MLSYGAVFEAMGREKDHSAQQQKKKPKPKPKLGELTCEVCMRAIDNIYADIALLAKEYSDQHGGATPGPDEGEDLVQRGLERACAGVKPKKVYRACNKVLLWQITSYVEELFSAHISIHNVCNAMHTS